MINDQYSHEVMEQIKVKVILDGDLAATILNLIAHAYDFGYVDKLLFCDHTAPKLQLFADNVNDQLDIENREEN